MTRLRLLAAVACLVCLAWGAPGARADDADASAKVVRGFMEAWSTADIDKVMAFVGDDVRYENIPPLGAEGTMTGKAKMQAFLAPFFTKDPLIVPMTFHTDIKRIIADNEGGVAVQRVDHQTFAGKDYPLAVAAFFTVKDGKIVSWTDYFDSAGFAPVGTLMQALAKKQ